MNFKRIIRKFEDIEYCAEKALKGAKRNSSSPLQTATSYIKKANKEFMDLTKIINRNIQNQINIVQKDPSVDLGRGNSFLGTLIDEYFQLKLAGKNPSNEELIIKTKMKIMYRSMFADFENTDEESILKAFRELEPQLNKTINSLENININPVFGNDILMADGDIIIDGVITELKFSKSKTFKVDYLRQLIVYMYLNKESDIFDVDYSKIGIIMPNYNYKNYNIDIESASKKAGTSLEYVFSLIDLDLTKKRNQRASKFIERSDEIKRFKDRIVALKKEVRWYSIRKNELLISNAVQLTSEIEDGYTKTFFNKI